MSDKPSDKPVVIFVHIPKVAGTSLRGLFNAVYGFDKIYDPFEQPDFHNKPKGTFDKYNVLFGHHHFGSHEQLLRPHIYVTALRDAVERVHSNWWYIRTHGSHHYFKDAEAAQTSLEFHKRGADPWNDNGMTRMLAGIYPPTRPYGQVTHEISTRAIENLAHIPIVGDFEHWHEFLVTLRRSLNWETVPFFPSRANVGVEKPPIAPLDRQGLEALEWRDTHLYRIAQTIAKPAAAWSDFSLEVRCVALLDAIGVRCLECCRAGWSSMPANTTLWAKHALEVHDGLVASQDIPAMGSDKDLALLREYVNSSGSLFDR